MFEYDSWLQRLVAYTVYNVFHHLAVWVGFTKIQDGAPYCPMAQSILPKFHLPQQTVELSSSQSTQPRSTDDMMLF